SPVIELLAQRLEFGDIYFFDIAEVWNLALGLLHFLRNLPAHAHYLDLLGPSFSVGGHWRPALVWSFCLLSRRFCLLNRRLGRVAMLADQILIQIAMADRHIA